MREIKFRGKTKVGGVWVYGFYQCGEQGGHEKHFISVSPWSVQWCVVPETVGQFTGVLDKNGKEIFEGDVCKGPNGKHWVICWMDYSWCMTNESIPNGRMKFGGQETYTIHKWLMLPPRRQELEIIGSIYENPELLQK